MVLKETYCITAGEIVCVEVLSLSATLFQARRTERRRRRFGRQLQEPLHSGETGRGEAETTESRAHRLFPRRRRQSQIRQNDAREEEVTRLERRSVHSGNDEKSTGELLNRGSLVTAEIMLPN